MARGNQGVLAPWLLMLIAILLSSTGALCSYVSWEGEPTPSVSTGLLPLLAGEQPAAVGKPVTAVRNSAIVSTAANASSAIQKRSALPPGLVAVANTPAAAAAQPLASASVVLYLRCRFLGRKSYFTATSIDLAGTALDNRVRAVTVPSGYKVTLYDGPNFTGSKLVLTQSSSCLPGSWARIVTSFTLEPVSSGGGGAGGGSGGGGGGGGGGGSGTASLSEQLLVLVNAARQAAGAGPLTIDARLIAAAQAHSNDQANRQRMGHDGSDGSTFTDRIERAGYNWSSGGENVAYGYPTVPEVFKAWMNSPGHRANILNPDFVNMGAASATSNWVYWTQEFASPL